MVQWISAGLVWSRTWVQSSKKLDFFFCYWQSHKQYILSFTVLVLPRWICLRCKSQLDNIRCVIFFECLCRLQSRHTCPMGIPVPELTLTLCQSRLYPPVRDQEFGLCVSILNLKSEPVFVNLFTSARINSQHCGPVRQPYFSYRHARLHRLAESMPRNRFLGSINVYKYGLS